jgi:hypothetical protein
MHVLTNLKFLKLILKIELIYALNISLWYSLLAAKTEDKILLLVTHTGFVKVLMWFQFSVFSAREVHCYDKLKPRLARYSHTNSTPARDKRYTNCFKTSPKI